MTSPAPSDSPPADLPTKLVFTWDGNPRSKDYGFVMHYGETLSGYTSLVPPRILAEMVRRYNLHAKLSERAK